MVWWFGLPFIGLRSLAGYLGLTLVFVWDSALCVCVWGGGLTSVFQGFLYSGLSFFGVRHLPDIF